ncbi:cyclodeaminase/cyclohydrolase family protein [Deinococcus sp. Marseille-Q6407]|uniref:cyclodeaminase/cyclohydrolase family protein n=1 Tax=Deinococcus sp. Marseille-Q6407 TaxID=2969223 RepID=UPI0021BF681B|nr:cyclodeaminase/cyclohydrolase family protein [Deinococcus sp. Marseille-Q6407]
MPLRSAEPQPAAEPPSLWTHTMQEVLDAAGARRSVPTGGSVVAVSGAFGVSLLILAVNLTLTKADPPAELTALNDKLRSLQARIQALGDADATLFAAFMKQARQPDTPAAEEDELRQQTREVPLQLARELQTGLALAQQLRPLVHTSVVSDIQAGGAILHGALQAALFTLANNLSSADAAQTGEFQVQRQQLEQARLTAQEWLEEEQSIKDG